MADAFDPDSGWREVTVFEYQPHLAPKIAVMEDDGETRYWVWVREKPVPPLPVAAAALLAMLGEEQR